MIYRPLYGEQAIWVRPLAMFLEHVTVDGHNVQLLPPSFLQNDLQVVVLF